jgi:hypothetical protein
VVHAVGLPLFMIRGFAHVDVISELIASGAAPVRQLSAP